MSEPASPQPPGVVDVGGEAHIRDAKGRLVPLSTVKAEHRLEDDLVRGLAARATALSAELAAFRGQAFEEAGVFQQLLDEQYKAKRGGEKGNVTFQTVDGCLRMQIAVADILSFGPELQAAKALVDECLVQWGEGAHPVMRALVQDAFDVDKEGQLNRSAIFKLLRVQEEDERWKRAMDAIRDSIRTTGSRQYVRFHRRARPTDRWEPISLDAANA